jgi:hypothetical protein
LRSSRGRGGFDAIDGLVGEGSEAEVVEETGATVTAVDELESMLGAKVAEDGAISLVGGCGAISGGSDGDAGGLA